MTEEPEQLPEILVITNLAAGSARTGSEVRSWHSIRALQSLGQVTVLSLAENSRGGTGQSAWTSAYLRTREEAAGTDHLRGTRGRAWLGLMGVLLMPWRRNWTIWMQYVLQYAAAGVASEGAKSRRLLNVIFQLHYGVLSQLGLSEPTFCCGLLQVWLQMRSRFMRAEANRRFDILWVENTICWPVAQDILSSFHSAPRLVVLNGQNIEYQVLEQAVKSSSCPVRRKFLTGEARLMRKLEIRAFATADLVIQCSDRDVREAEKLVSSVRGWVFPNGVDTSEFVHQPDKLRAVEPTVLFPASFRYGPNIDGAEFLACAVWPRVKAVYPGAKLMFAGYDAECLRRYSWLADPSIELISSPEDMKPVIARAWLVAVPLLSGGGTRLKILEAMSSGRAVVSTGIGAEGVPYEDGRHLLLADSAETFADAINRLMGDNVFRGELEQNAALFVRNHYDWKKLGEGMRKTMRALSAEVKEA